MDDAIEMAPSSTELWLEYLRYKSACERFHLPVMMDYAFYLGLWMEAHRG